MDYSTIIHGEIPKEWTPASYALHKFKNKSGSRLTNLEFPISLYYTSGFCYVQTTIGAIES